MQAAPSLEPTDPMAPPATLPQPIAAFPLTLFGRACRRALREPRLWLGLWLLNLAVTVICALPLLWVLADLLGDRPRADALARGQADALLLDLLVHGPGVWSSVGFGVLAATVLHWAIHVSLSGGLLPAMLAPGLPSRVPSESVLRQAAARLGLTWRLEVLAVLTLRLPLLLLLAGGAALIGRGQRPLTGTFSVLLGNYAPLVGLGLLLWASLSVAIHVARLRLLTAPGGGGQAAYRVLKGTLRSLVADAGLLQTVATLALLFVLSYGVLLVAARLGAGYFDYRLQVGLALAVRQLAAMGRGVLALSQLAAAGELWRSQAPSEAQTRI